MEERLRRGWGLLINVAEHFANLLAGELVTTWLSYRRLIAPIPILPDSSVRLISLCCGDREVTQRCSRRPSRVLALLSG